jgi:hypothetical protein
LEAVGSSGKGLSGMAFPGSLVPSSDPEYKGKSRPFLRKGRLWFSGPKVGSRATEGAFLSERKGTKNAKREIWGRFITNHVSEKLYLRRVET